MPAEPLWDEVEQLFDAALEQPETERLVWLDRATPDPKLRAMVGRMLAAHSRAGGPLDRQLDATPLSLPLRLGAALGGHYVIDEEIGRGGMGTVYRARERKHDRQVVVKVLNPEAAAAFGAERFLTEIHVAAQLSHPNILALLDSGEADGLLYYVMPYLGGETLRQRLRTEGRLDVGLTLRLLRSLAEALAAAHRSGVVHRDLKPENILLVGDHAYLLDFGIAQLRDTRGKQHETAQGGIMGTPGYMAPEQEAGAPTDARTDLYALGVLARELLTGQSPGHFASIIPATLPPETPACLLAFLTQCTQPDPADRPASAEAALAILEGHSTGVPTSPRRRSRRPLILAAVAVLAVGAWLTLDRSPRPVATARLALPVVVAPLQNETGDSTLGAWGRMAGDWITQGLQETGAVTVVPWPSAREAGERYQRAVAAGESPDQVKLLREETGAGTVISGSYYLVGDRVRFQAQITDAASGASITYPEPTEAPRDSVAMAIRQLRARVMGALAIQQDEMLARVPGLAERPPTFEAYRAFDRAMSQHLAQDYDSAAANFRQAFALDSTFGLALLFGALDLWNISDYAGVDSTLQILRSRRIPLSRYHDQLAEYLTAVLAGEGDRAYATIRQAADPTADARGQYTLAWIANATNRPAVALAALQRLDPDRGTMRRWAPFWVQRSHAQHQLGDFAAELATARAMRERHPDSRMALVLAVRAAAAMGNVPLTDSLLAESAMLSPDTYWSQGAALVVAGEELTAHGRGFVAGAYFNRAVRWLANQLTQNPNHRAHRYWMGSALYDAGRWPEAAPYFNSLAADFPDRLEYRGLSALIAMHEGRPAEAERRLGPRPRYNPGQYTAMRARLAAVAGQRDQALALLAQSAAQGYEGWPWIHAAAHRDFGPYEQDPAYRALLAGRQAHAATP